MLGFERLFGVLLTCLGASFAWDRGPGYAPHVIGGLPRGQHQEFRTNSTDHLRLLSSTDNFVVLGGRNALYNVTVGLDGHLDLTGKLIWGSTDAHRELCTLKGKQEGDCQNYIRIFAEVNPGRALICGTNSYKPMCRHYSIPLSEKDDTDKENEEAQGRCPYSPTHSSAYTYTDGHLFTGTVADFSGADPLIYRENQRTEQYDLKQLNQPAFVSATSYDEYAFFFFREIAMEYMNCGKAVYSRVGRVCKNDRGGPAIFYDRWTSFLKARLNCSLPGEYPFYFDYLSATTDVVKLSGEDVVYGVFGTPPTSIEGSAVCVFRMKDILEAFEGPFKAQKDTRSNWLPVSTSLGPTEPRPGSCVEDSRTLPSQTVNFVKNHPLMEKAVPALYGEPLLVTTGAQLRLTSVAVVPTTGPDGRAYSVLFAGTADGRLVKFYAVAGNTLQKVVVSEMQVLPPGQAVKQLTTVGKQILAISENSVVSIPQSDCSNYTNCASCVGTRDPFCGWHEESHSCREVGTVPLGHLLDTAALYDVCPENNWVEERVVTHGTISSVGRDPQSGFLVHESHNHTCPEIAVAGAYSAQTMAIALVVVAAVALAVGGLVGIVVGHKCRLECPMMGVPPMEHRNQLTWSKSRHMAHHSKDINLLMNTNQFYSPPASPHPVIFSNAQEPTPQARRKMDNLGLVDFDVDGKDRRHESKNSTESLEKDPQHFKTDTLQKVKKTYI
ncbi:semaphorin-1A-like [Lutzomyia longipalpis]|uniref:semaphorin-1A-like n=1 Tax=Lutzomyia longipalpis TaxID=7200 RepID=UPI0024837EEA|nr:semaphorin-1A-like [Lutzomyia longipalpis]